MKRFAITGILIFLYITAFAQGYDRLFYEAYRDSRMDRWLSLMEDMEKEWKETGNRALLNDLAVAQYGYIAYLMSEKDHKTARIYIRKNEEALETLKQGRMPGALVYSLESALFGFKVGVEKYKAVIYGPRSMEAIEKALGLDSINPFALQVRANMEYFRPPLFGGSKEGSIPWYEKAVRYYEAAPALTTGNWVYLNCLTSLAIAYEQTGRRSQAGELYRKILRLEPGFTWVRDELYPRFKAAGKEG
ncbi:MAG: tetratricopeptide repeat protein [Bacteroidota bacterium]